MEKEKTKKNSLKEKKKNTESNTEFKETQKPKHCFGFFYFIEPNVMDIWL